MKYDHDSREKEIDDLQRGFPLQTNGKFELRKNFPVIIEGDRSHGQVPLIVFVGEERWLESDGIVWALESQLEGVIRYDG